MAHPMLVLLGMVLMVRSILSHNERLRGMELSLKSAKLNAQEFPRDLAAAPASLRRWYVLESG